jgi:hypothetical protein
MSVAMGPCTGGILKLGIPDIPKKVISAVKGKLVKLLLDEENNSHRVIR